MAMLHRRNFIGGAGVILGTSPSLARELINGQRTRLGVNLAHAEFRSKAGAWTWPDISNARYYLDMGFQVLRIPFLWERLQPSLEDSVVSESLTGLDSLIELAAEKDAVILLDAHNYGRRDGKIIAQDKILSEAFAKFWGVLARRYGHRQGVWFGLMNEPHDEDGAQNVRCQNAAARAIRAEGALGVILFSGVAWTGGHSWIKSGNSVSMLAAFDPLNNYAYDIHQYLDPGFGGSHVSAVPGIGASVLQAVYDWALQNNRRLFLGEFASGPSSDALSELRSLLQFVCTRPSIFIGATYWAGGGGWGANAMTTDPLKSAPSSKKPQLSLLLSFLGR